MLPEVFAVTSKAEYPDVSVNIKSADYGKILESVQRQFRGLFGVGFSPCHVHRLTVLLIPRDLAGDYRARPNSFFGQDKIGDDPEGGQCPLVVQSRAPPARCLDPTFLRARRL